MALLENLTKEYYKSGFKPRSAEARAWFMGRLQGFDGISADRLMADKLSLTPKAMIGGMFFFYYDAKTKDTLPFWDKFPLIVPVDFYSDSFAGINFHYLDPWARAALLDKLTQVSGNKHLDSNAKLKITYNYLKSARKFKEVGPCYKKYLYTHLRSKFLTVQPEEFEVAIFLPVQQFQKATASSVWEDTFFKAH